MNDQEREFHEAMVNIYVSAKRDCGYTATRFLQMIGDLGGLGAAHALLRTSEVQYGFTELWEQNRLDLTVEALVLQQRWQNLFAEAERAVARERLTAHRFPTQ